MTNELLLHKEKESHRTNGTFAFAPKHRTTPSAKSKEPFFAALPDTAL